MPNLTREMEEMSRKSGHTAKIDRREAFIRHYLIQQNAALAYRAAGYQDGPGTRQSAHRLLTSAYVQTRLTEERQRLFATLDVKVEDVFKRLKRIAFSDIATIVSCHIYACRYCNGINNAYQWRTPREYEQALADAINESERTGKPAKFPTNDGGYGYSTHLAPNSDCPECDGRGIREVVFKDTRLLTEEERAVFTGVQITQGGIKYRFEDRAKALESLARHLQFYREREQTNGKMTANWLDQMAAAGRVQRMPIR
jgi:hypothetical protein